MSRNDRLVAGACRHLEPDETLLASAVGREPEGRRRRVVLVTDRRIVVAWTRPEPPRVLRLIECRASFDRHDRTLALFDGQASALIRDVPPASADMVVDCIARLNVTPVRERIGQAWHVRIVGS